MALQAVEEGTNIWDELKSDLQVELEQHRKELKEIALMLEQSQLEVNKLAQRNTSINAHLKQIQAQFDSLPRADIRMTYDSALDAQQRLFVMRGQVEKLQNDQAHLNRRVTLIDRLLKTIDGGASNGNGSHGASATIEMVEMVIQAQEAERQRLSRQMHDGPAQALSNFILQTEIAMRLFDIDQAKAREELANLKASATSTFQKVRDFIFELRPMMLDDLGLAPTLKRYMDASKEQSGMEIRMTITGVERRLESYQEVMVFRAIQELLSNAARHSQATQVKVQLDMGETNVKIVVDDNGKGFDVESQAEMGSMGLKRIRDRVEMVGGYLNVDSVPGQGTRVTFQIPASAPAPAG
ncbi:MAG TPA: sensor histidine kinase [Anaerolineales bacterium]